MDNLIDFVSVRESKQKLKQFTDLDQCITPIINQFLAQGVEPEALAIYFASIAGKISVECPGSVLPTLLKNSLHRVLDVQLSKQDVDI